MSMGGGRGRNSSFWIMVLAAVLVVCLTVGLSMFGDLDPTPQYVVELRAWATMVNPNSELTLRLEPRPGVELAKGEKRKRILVLGLPVEQELLTDPERTADYAASVLKRIHRTLRDSEASYSKLSRDLDFIQIAMWPLNADEKVRAAPPYSQRFPYEPSRPKTYDPTPPGPESGGTGR